MKEVIITDNELGRLVVRYNVKARRVIFRSKSDGIYVTVPYGASAKEISEIIEKQRHNLIQLRSKTPSRQIDFNFSIQTEHFTIRVVAEERKDIVFRTRQTTFEIGCPPDTIFENARLQEVLEKYIGEYLRKHAKIQLPPRLYTLAKEHGFVYNDVKINSSKSRWGSCSDKRNINLSYYIVLLPPHLIDNILLHELCHTREMNHSPLFWKQMDIVSKGKAQEWNAELRKYAPSVHVLYSK